MKIQIISFSSYLILKVMNQGANINGQTQGRRRAFQTPPINPRTFSGDVRAPVPKRYLEQSMREIGKSLWFCRTQHPSLLTSNQVSQPQHDPANGADPTQPQPSAPPSPSFTPLSPSNPSPFPPSRPSGLIPHQDPRLPSLYLPSYDEAVNMQ